MKKAAVILFITLLLALGVWCISVPRLGSMVKSQNSGASMEMLKSKITGFADSEDTDLLVDGKSISMYGYEVRVRDDMTLLCSENFLEDIIGCSVSRYPDGSATLERGAVQLSFSPDVTKTSPDNSDFYIPLNEELGELGFKAGYVLKDRAISFTSLDEGVQLPSRYDMREKGRVTPVRDQGAYGTCWAFASLGALESTLLPYENHVFSVDHMSMNNSYSLDVQEGGEHSISISYLASWLGPVEEEDDPYGDGETNLRLNAVKHLEEAIIMKKRDDKVIKSAIYKYGGVETSLYLEMNYGESESTDYNPETAAYFYAGDETPNHATVVVGWDDDYPRSNFKKCPSRDGAFICKNSWGTEFGDEGYFYVSYDDVNICNQAIVYTRLASARNFDHIYQSDMLGWVGHMGFGKDSAYFANCYTTEKKEKLAAVSFYATGDDTSFEVYIVRNFEGKQSLNDRELIGRGKIRYSGYYTVKLKDQIPLAKGEKYAVMIHITTPGVDRPIAIECDAGSKTEGVNLSDGEGYISLYGEVWHNAEASDCNVCLKAFTNDDEE